MKALLFIFSVLLIILFAGLWIGSGSYPDRWRLQDEITAQKEANQQQKEKNRKIQAELDDLASGDDAIEERARSELGMTKKGETFYEVVLQPEPDHADTNKVLEAQTEKKKVIKLLDQPASVGDTDKAKKKTEENLTEHNDREAKRPDSHVTKKTAREDHD